ncbi:MAG: tetratricopeptide repeat protein [Alphaproteobacteria bacterium]
MATEPEHGDGEPVVGTPGELLRLAARHVNDGRFPAAAAICEAVIANDPENATAFHILGHVRARARNDDAAIGYFMRAVTLAPTNVAFSRSFAEALEKSGRNAQAVHAWEQYITLAPEDALARYAFGVALYRAGRYRDAAEQFQYALSCEPARKDWAECHNALSATLRECRRFGDAVRHARRAVAISPKLASAHNNLGLALLDSNDEPGALAALETAVRLRPDDPETINNLGVVLAGTGRFPAAETQFRRALALRPGWADAHLNLANALRQAEQPESAMKHYNAALASAPDDFRVHGSMALAWQNLDQPENALASYQRALALAPENLELLKGLGIVQLWRGDFRNGWRNYEQRLQCRDFPRRDLASRQWTGEPLDGGALLVHAEQGFGDTLQFCRYLPLLSDRSGAGSIVFECQRPLVDLMRSLDGRHTLVARGDPLPHVDSHVALMSLPLHFNTDQDTIPAKIPYLAATPEKIAQWRSRLRDPARPNIGLVWFGNPLRQDDNMRSCPLEALTPVLKRRDLNLYSLQMDAVHGDTVRLEQHGVTDWSRHIAGFLDTAAALCALDLVITVDTATAHLAGALGKPVWVLLGKAADWRYLRNRGDSPWYPSMTLYRQHRRGDWEELASRVSDRLPGDSPSRSNSR